MPDNTPIDGHADAGGPGATLSAWSTGRHKPGRRILPPVTLASIQRLMPPLAARIWRQRDLFTRKRGRLAVSATEPIGITSSLTSRLPRLLTDFIPRLRAPTTLSSVWPRLLDLTWFRRRRKPRNESRQKANAIREERLADNTSQRADELYAGEPRQIGHLAEDEVTAVDEDYPLIIKNLLSSPVSRIEPNDTTDDSFEPSYNTPMPFRAKPLTNEPATNDGGGSAVSSISPIGLRSIPQASQIQRLNRRQVKDTEGRLVRTDWQPHHTYRSRSPDQTWPPLIQSLVPYRILTPQPADITGQSAPWGQAALAQHQPHLIARLAEEEPGSQATTQPTSAARIPEAIGPAEETAHAGENDSLPLTLENESNLLPLLPGQSQPTGYGKMMNRAGQSARPETRSGSSEPVLNSLPLNKQAASGLLSTRAIWQRAPETSRSVQPVFPEIRLPKTIRRITGATGVLGDSPITVPGQDTATTATPTNVSHVRSRQTEISLLRRESLFAADLHHQSPLVSDSIRQAPTLLYQPYSRPIDDTLAPDRSESRESLPVAGLRRQSPILSNIIRQAPTLPYQPYPRPIDDTIVPGRGESRESLSAASLRRQSPILRNIIRQAPTPPYQPYPRPIDDTPVPDRSEGRESLSVAGWRRQSPLVSDSIRKAPAPPYQSYLKPLDDTAARNRNRDRSLIDNQAHQPTARKDNRQSELGPPTVSVTEPKTHADATQTEGTIPAIFERETYYASQTMPELALAPVEQPAPAPATPPEAETKAREEAEEATTPDIDAIARDVYTILKRRLAREREQALGVS